MTHENEGLLGVRKTVKRRKPSFKLRNSNDRKKRFAGKWRKPKGLHSKIRLKKKSHPAAVESGYGSPSSVRGATREGLFPVPVKTVAEIEGLKEGAAVVIAAGVGVRKRLVLFKEASARKLRIVNLDSKKVEQVSKAFAERKKKRREFLKRRKQAPSAPAAVKEESIESKLSDEDRKKTEKAEKDKVLTKAK